MKKKIINPDITRIDDGRDTITYYTVIDDRGIERTMCSVVSRYGVRITGETGKNLLKMFFGEGENSV